MDKQQFLQILNYPDPWSDMNLFPDELFALQRAVFHEEYGNQVLEGGTEHFRYGAFQFWLRRGASPAILDRLLTAASVDPDKPMAGAAIKDIVGHAASNHAHLLRAKLVIEQSPEFYITAHDLEVAFGQKSIGL